MSISKLLARVVFAAVGVMSLQAQNAVAPWLDQRFWDQNGRPLANGKVRVCLASQPCPGSVATVYTSSSGFTPYPQVISLNALGQPQIGTSTPSGIWLTPGVGYQFATETAGGVPVATIDNVFGASITSGGGGSGTPGGSTTNVQFNLLGAFAGSGNFTWNNTTQTLTLTGIAGTPGLVSTNGFIQSSGGFLSSVTGGSWQGFNTNTDGALFRGYALAQNTSNNAGGYLAIAPITYNPHNGSPCTDIYGNPVQQPMPLNGLSNFGTNDAILWVGTSPVMPSGGSCGAPIPVNTTYGLNTNTYVFARGGFATDNNAYNSIQSLQGGAYVKLGVTVDQALYPKSVLDCATLNTPGAGYGGFAYKSDNNYCYYNATTLAWATVDLSASGGGTTPGGSTTNVQYNNAGAFGGSGNMTWNNAGRLLTVTALNATSAGIAVATGFMQADKGFLATPVTANLYNSFYAPSGGMAALSFTASKYMNVGSNNGIPAPTSGDTINPGAQYCDIGTSPCVPKLWNGLAWVSLATGGATSPGGATTNVQFNSGGSFAGTANLTYSSQLLNSVASSSSAAGMSVTNGFMQAENGFLAAQFAVPSTALNYNVIQAPTGGMAAKSFTATTYIQVGTYSSGGVGTPPPLTTGDSFHPGALSWDTDSGGNLKVWNGISWNLVGGGGSPATPVTAVQYNGGSGFAGTANFVWDNALRRLTVTTAGATAGLAVGNGYIQADTGFLATLGTATAFNAIQAPGGGMSAKSFTATKYVNTGNNSGIPTLTSGDSFNAGALYCDTSTSPCVEKLWNGSAWVSILSNGVQSLNAQTGVVLLQGTANQVNVASGGGTITLSTPQPIATTSLVTFGQISAAVIGSTIGFQTSNGNYAVNGNGDISTVGIVSANGSGGGVNVPTNTATNAIQAPNGGVSAKSIAAVSTANAVVTAQSSAGDVARLTLNNTNGGRNWDLSSWGGALPHGTLAIADETAGAVRFQIDTAGTISNGAGTVSFDTAGTNTAVVHVGTSTAFNAFRDTSGGGNFRSVTNTTYTQVGQSSGAPSATSGDTIGNGTVYYDTGTSQLMARIAGSFVALSSGAALSNINSQTGPGITIQGTSNQVSVSSGANVITLSTPQSIATNSNPTFAGVISTSTFNSTVTGATIGLQVNSGNFQVNGNGVVSAAGAVTSSTGLASTNTALNSIQTAGSFNACNAATCVSSAAYQVHGSTVIDNSGQFIGAAVLAPGNVQTGGVFAVSGGFFGETTTIVASGSCTLFVRGGIIYGHTGC